MTRPRRPPRVAIPPRCAASCSAASSSAAGVVDDRLVGAARGVHRAPQETLPAQQRHDLAAEAVGVRAVADVDDVAGRGSPCTGRASGAPARRAASSAAASWASTRWSTKSRTAPESTSTTSPRLLFSAPAVGMVTNAMSPFAMSAASWAKASRSQPGVDHDGLLGDGEQRTQRRRVGQRARREQLLGGRGEEHLLTADAGQVALRQAVALPDERERRGAGDRLHACGEVRAGQHVARGRREAHRHAADGLGQRREADEVDLGVVVDREPGEVLDRADQRRAPARRTPRRRSRGGPARRRPCSCCSTSAFIAGYAALILSRR